MQKKTTKRKSRKRRRRYGTVAVSPDVNTQALADCLTKFMLASEKQIVRKFAHLPDARVIDCGVYGDAVYVPGLRDNSALLIAHYDTVWGKERIGIKHDGYTLRSSRKDTGIGADDRAGVAALWLLRSMGHALLIVPAEEIGCQGSRVLAKTQTDLLNLHTFAIQFDRRGGHDLVTYDCENDDFDRFLLAMFPGYSHVPGSYSDISELCPAAGIAGVNISIGFECEHMTRETLDLLDFARTLSLTRSLLKRTTLPRFEYVDGWGDDKSIWKVIDEASDTTGAATTNQRYGKAKPGKGKGKVIDVQWTPSLVTPKWPRKLGSSLTEHWTESDSERWCLDCGNVCLCDLDLVCRVCGGENTEALAG